MSGTMYHAPTDLNYFFRTNRYPTKSEKISNILMYHPNQFLLTVGLICLYFALVLFFKLTMEPTLGGRNKPILCRMFSRRD